MRIKKQLKRDVRYLPLEDIKQIDDAFLNELESVKWRLGYVKDEAVIKAFHEVLLSAYNAAIEIRTLEREVDYEIKLTEIGERKRALKPWRRCWLWRLLLQPLTNRAQRIIEDRAELDADRAHGEAERAIKEERRKLRQALELKKLQATLEKADATDTNEAFYNEPGQECADAEAAGDVEPLQEPSPPPFTSGRRPRPPRSCRKQ